MLPWPFKKEKFADEDVRMDKEIIQYTNEGESNTMAGRRGYMSIVPSSNIATLGNDDTFPRYQYLDAYPTPSEISSWYTTLVQSHLAPVDGCHAAHACHTKEHAVRAFFLLARIHRLEHSRLELEDRLKSVT